MENLDKDSVIQILKKLNPALQQSQIVMYANLFIDYTTAQRNIDKHGSMVMHPKTGEPIENPYLKIRDKAFSNLQKMRVKADALWE